jgi:hypothetical protein
MKWIMTLFFCIVLQGFSFAQNNKISIQTNAPRLLKAGKQFVLKVKVTHNYSIEKTGNLTLSLFNPKTKTSVDGWFINVFPFQYFTTITNTPFETEFPFTVPDMYMGPVEVLLVAEVEKTKDSIRIVIPTQHK